MTTNLSLGLNAQFLDLFYATTNLTTVQDGEFVDEHHIFHRCLHGVVETPDGEDCAAIIQLSQSDMVLTGRGRVQSAKFSFSTWTAQIQPSALQRYRR